MSLARLLPKSLLVWISMLVWSSWCLATFGVMSGVVTGATAISLPAPVLIQIGVLPVLVGLVATIPFALRGTLLLLSLAGNIGVLSTLRHYREPLDQAGILVALLKDDPLEKRTRIERIRFESDRTSKDIHLIRYPTEIHDEREAEAVLRGRPHISALLWGSERWLRLTLPRREPFALSDHAKFPLTSIVGGLRIIQNVQHAGLSFDKAGATYLFLAELFRGLPEMDSFVEEREAALRSAGALGSHWTTTAHRALPLFLLGNQYLEHFLSASEYEPAWISCAVDQYQEAMGLLRYSDNPALSIALTNNTAVALVLSGFFLEEKKAFARARFLLRKIQRPAALKSGLLHEVYGILLRNKRALHALPIASNKAQIRDQIREVIR